jgi:hypothetical protein
MTYVLPVLPDELSTTLADGVVAVLRPLDHTDVATLFDAFPPSADDNIPLAAAPWLVKRQLVRIEGLAIGSEGTPFDATNALHLTALPWSWVQACAKALYSRMNLSEASAKNSDAPSVLAVPISGAS